MNSACRSVSSGARAPRLSAACLPGPCGKAERCEQGARPGRHNDSALRSVVRENESQGRRAAGGREPRSCCRHVQSARSPHRPRSPSAHLPAARAHRSVGRRRSTLHNPCRGCWLPIGCRYNDANVGNVARFFLIFLHLFFCRVGLLPDGSTSLWS